MNSPLFDFVLRITKHQFNSWLTIKSLGVIAIMLFVLLILPLSHHIPFSLIVPKLPFSPEFHNPVHL